MFFFHKHDSSYPDFLSKICCFVTTIKAGTCHDVLLEIPSAVVFINVETLWCLITNIQWFLPYKCRNTVMNCSHWLLACDYTTFSGQRRMWYVIWHGEMTMWHIGWRLGRVLYTNVVLLQCFPHIYFTTHFSILAFQENDAPCNQLTKWRSALVLTSTVNHTCSADRDALRCENL